MNISNIQRTFLFYYCYYFFIQFLVVFFVIANFSFCARTHTLSTTQGPSYLTTYRSNYQPTLPSPPLNIFSFTSFLSPFLLQSQHFPSYLTIHSLFLFRLPFPLFHNSFIPILFISLHFSLFSSFPMSPYSETLYSFTMTIFQGRDDQRGF